MRHLRTAAGRATGAILISALITACGSGGVVSTRSDTSDTQTTTGVSVSTAPVPSIAPAPTLPPVPTTSAPTTIPATTPPSSAPVTAVEPSPTSVAPPTTVPTVATPDLVRFTPNVFLDPMSDGAPAISVLVPEGWTASGSVQWLPYWSRLAFLQTHVADPASGVSLDWLPIQDFVFFPEPAGFDVPIGGNYQGKAYVPPITDPAAFVRDFWMPTDLPDLQQATLVSVVEVPEAAAEFVAAFGGPAEAHAYRLRYAYEVNGRAWERDVSFALLFTGDASFTSWFVNFASTVSGPAGAIDAQASVLSSIYASRITTPEWEGNYRLVQRLFYRGLQQQMADTVAFGKLLAQYRAESQALQAQVTAERQASQDHQAEVFRETLVGVQTYVDPVNGTLVQLPVDWNQYWVNTEGEYLAVDQPGFDPNSLDDGTWQPLVPQR
jgi:hypothetical protein